VRWSVSLTAEGDRVLTHEEIVELADAVAVHEGIASGIGSMSYGAQLVVQAASSDEAVDVAMAAFTAAVAHAGLPPWPVTRAETISEDEDLDYSDDAG
jgi:hypothetical protein